MEEKNGTSYVLAWYVMRQRIGLAVVGVGSCRNQRLGPLAIRWRGEVEQERDPLQFDSLQLGH